MLDRIKAKITHKRVKFNYLLDETEKQWLDSQWKFEFNATWAQKIHWVEFQEHPMCPENNPKRFVGYFTGYGNTCNNKQCKTCAEYKRSLPKLAKQAFKDKWGTDNPSNLKWVCEKRQTTLETKYGQGITSTSQLPEIRKKQQQTCITNYGSTNPFGSKEIQLRVQETIRQKFGVDNISHSPEIKQKIQQSKHAYYEQLKSSTLSKKINTNLQRYGTATPTKQDFSRARLTNLYGEHTFEVLNSKDKLAVYMERSSIDEVAEALGVSYSTVAQRSIEFGIRDKFENWYETVIQKILTNHGLEVERNRRFDWMMGLELDFYIPSLKLAIEFNGVRWHSLEVRGDPNYHIRKLELCEQHNVGGALPELVGWPKLDRNLFNWVPGSHKVIAPEVQIITTNGGSYSIVETGFKLFEPN